MDRAGEISNYCTLWGERKSGDWPDNLGISLAQSQE